jgi:hypothetical protein
MAGRRAADWRFPNEKQARAEETLRRMQHGPDDTRSGSNEDPAPSSYQSAAPATDDDAWWTSVLSDPRAKGRPPLPIQQRRLSEISRQMLRAECDKCGRLVEIQTADAVKLFGPHVIWKDAAMSLLVDGCKARAGNRDTDGCWPFFRT